MTKRRGRSILVTAATALLPLGFADSAIAADDLPVWGSVPSADRGERDNALLGVDVIAADDVWAVGEYNSGVVPIATGRRTLAQHWDGTKWRLVTTPNPSFNGLDFANLEDVSGVAGNDVWAVGHGDDFSTGRSKTLVEHWDGERWRIVKSPNPGLGANRLLGVGASAESTWAVGEKGQQKALILRFDGTKWREVPNECGATLRAVTNVPGTSTAWAVGDYSTCFFDGATWSRVSAPGAPDLAGVAARSSSDVWAVGAIVTCDGFTCYSASAIRHWDGSRWTSVSHPLASELRGVDAADADDAWAVGTNNLGTVIQHWDGSSWRNVPSPDPESGGGLNDVDAATPGAMWSAGYFYGDARQRTLAVQAPSTTQGQVIGATGVSQATVSWFGKKATGSTQTDVFGDYTIAGLPVGRYTLTVTDQFDSCEPSTAQVRIAANATSVVDFDLDCSL